MKTLKPLLIFCLLVCLFSAGCSQNGDDTDTDPPFAGSIIYAPESSGDGDRVRIPADTTDAPDTDAVPETSDTDADADTDTDTDTEPVDTTDTDTVVDTEPVPDTDEPSEDTTAPSEDTQAPIQTADGAEIIDISRTLAVGFPVSGQFVSKQNPRLRLAVNYDCSMAVDGTVTVTLDVGLLAHDIRCGGRPDDMGEFTIDGVTYNFSTDEIVNESGQEVYVPFISHTYTVDSDRSSSRVDVSWMFNGIYGSERIDELSASAYFTW